MGSTTFLMDMLGIESRKVIEEDILRALGGRGPLDLSQIAVDTLLPVGVTDEFDQETFDALDRLERIGWLEWYPITKENPTAEISDPPNYLWQRVYHIARPHFSLEGIAAGLTPNGTLHAVRGETDMREAYGSKFQLLPEHMPEHLFQLSQRDLQAYFLDPKRFWERHFPKPDRQLVEGTREVLSNFDIPLRDTYFIVDAVGALLPAVVAQELLPRDIDAYFNIFQSPHDHHTERLMQSELPYPGSTLRWARNLTRETRRNMKFALLYFARDVEKRQEGMENYSSLATLLNLHRDQGVDENNLASLQHLRDLGIQNIVYLADGYLGVVPSSEVPKLLDPEPYGEEKTPIEPYRGDDMERPSRSKLPPEYLAAVDSLMDSVMAEVESSSRKVLVSRPSRDLMEYLRNAMDSGFNLHLAGIRPSEGITSYQDTLISLRMPFD